MTISENEKPYILVVDDEPNELPSKQAKLELDDFANVSVLHPQKVKLAHLETADLVLVDYRLDHWMERDIEKTVSFRPENGLALAVVLREQADGLGKDNLTAFALHTGFLGKIKGRWLPSETAQHVVARLNNLEWVFPKSESRDYDQILILANAVKQLPKKWPEHSDKSENIIKNLLAIEVSPKWSELCWREVLECRAPIHEMTSGRHGILFARWLLHEVLPYPSFLWSEYWVAARLGITLKDLRKVIKGDNSLAEDLESMRYSGILSGFLGERWWRGAIEGYVWELAGRSRAEEKTLQQSLAERAQMKLRSIDLEPALVSLDVNLEPTERFVSPMTAVTLRPDHWPAFADPAWMDIETVRENPLLQSIVDPLDMHRVGISE